MRTRYEQSSKVMQVWRRRWGVPLLQREALPFPVGGFEILFPSAQVLPLRPAVVSGGPSWVDGDTQVGPAAGLLDGVPEVRTGQTQLFTRLGQVWIPRPFRSHSHLCLAVNSLTHCLLRAFLIFFLTNSSVLCLLLLLLLLFCVVIQIDQFCFCVR